MRHIRPWRAFTGILLTAACLTAACGLRAPSPTATPSPPAASVLTVAPGPTPTSTPVPPTPLPTIGVAGRAATAAAYVGQPLVLPTPGATAAPEATVQPPPSPAQAEGVVRAYFAAVDADSPDGMRAQTEGQGRADTDRIIAEMDRQAAEAGVTPDMRVTSLSLTMLPAEGAVQPVRAESVIAAYVGVGPFAVAAQQIRSSGTFSVAMTGAGPKIIGISGQIVP